MEKTLEQYKIEAAEIAAIRKSVNDEKMVKIIDAENKIKQIAKDFVNYLNVNKSKLEGKKLFLTDGGTSKVFQTIFNEFRDGLNLTDNETCHIEYGYGSVKLFVTICCSGGSYDNHTHYCTYVKRGIYNSLTVDVDGKLLTIMEDVNKQMGDDYNVGMCDTAIELISDLKNDLKLIEEKINRMKQFIPNDLQNNY